MISHGLWSWGKSEFSDPEISTETNQNIWEEVFVQK